MRVPGRTTPLSKTAVVRCTWKDEEAYVEGRIVCTRKDEVYVRGRTILNCYLSNPTSIGPQQASSPA